ncbi:MAG: hypothetical protein R3A52_23315 [Polyangiales bacterium]
MRPLGRAAVLALLADTLKRSSDDVAELVEEILPRTGATRTSPASSS